MYLMLIYNQKSPPWSCRGQTENLATWRYRWAVGARSIQWSCPLCSLCIFELSTSHESIPKICDNFSWGWVWTRRSNLSPDALEIQDVPLPASWRYRSILGSPNTPWLPTHHKVQKVLDAFAVVSTSYQAKVVGLRRWEVSHCQVGLRCSG